MEISVYDIFCITNRLQIHWFLLHKFVLKFKIVYILTKSGKLIELLGKWKWLCNTLNRLNEQNLKQIALKTLNIGKEINRNIFNFYGIFKDYFCLVKA